jgi:hypothetical protein
LIFDRFFLAENLVSIMATVNDGVRHVNPLVRVVGVGLTEQS